MIISIMYCTQVYVNKQLIGLVVQSSTCFVDQSLGTFKQSLADGCRFMYTPYYLYMRINSKQDGIKGFKRATPGCFKQRYMCAGMDSDGHSRLIVPTTVF